MLKQCSYSLGKFFNCFNTNRRLMIPVNKSRKIALGFQFLIISSPLSSPGLVGVIYVDLSLLDESDLSYSDPLIVKTDFLIC
jgi:hypothetical protein